MRALLYTHSHVDHFGGAAGVVDEADVRAGRVPVIAPEGFLEHAVAENVLAGTAMQRRAQYMYGALLHRGPRGQVDAGLGKTNSTGTVSLIPPTVSITHTGQELEIDGVEMLFQITPGSEAPAEMNFLFPQHRVLCAAENTSHNMHNIVTLRGALVRDALGVVEVPERDDRAVRRAHRRAVRPAPLADLGSRERRRVPPAAARPLPLPARPDDAAAEPGPRPARRSPRRSSSRRRSPDAWHCRGYYGSVSHNVKAIAQRYLGWFDGNPARLHALPPAEAVGPLRRLHGWRRRGRRARHDGRSTTATTAGWCRSSTTSCSQSRTTPGARTLQAAALEQLGYQTENATWRNFYLMGAHELRDGRRRAPTPPTRRRRRARAWSRSSTCSACGSTGRRRQRATLVTNWDFTDTGEQFVVDGRARRDQPRAGSARPRRGGHHHACRARP